jgi:hypothetical protein
LSQAAVSMLFPAIERMYSVLSSEHYEQTITSER